MRIVYIHSQSIPSRAANTIQVMRSCAAFADLGHEVILIAPAAGGDRADDIFDWYGVTGFKMSLVTPPKAPVAEQLGRTFLLARRALSSDSDLIYGRDVITLALVARLTRREMILEVHAPFDPPTPRVHRLAYRSLTRGKRLAGVVTNSTDLAAYLALDAPGITFHPAPNAAPPTGGVKPAWPPRDRLQVGYTGHLYQGRGIDLILMLADRLGHVDFHLVGGAELDVRRLRDAKLPANVELHGFVPPGQIDSHIAACDVLIAPYQHDVAVSSGAGGDWARWMSPIKLAQYMAHGKAIVCSNHDVLADLVDDSVAILVAPDDVDGWQRAIEALHEEQLRRRLGEAAYHRFRNRHLADLRASGILKALVPKQPGVASTLRAERFLD